jgi:hypothetical protein
VTPAYHCPVPRSRALSLWLPVVVWAAVIFAFSAVPSLGTGLGTWDLVLRKLAHMTEYAVLALLLARALGRALPAFAVGVAYAASDEFHQTFVRGREGRPLDVAIDSVGLAAGLLLWSRRRR